jgi:uncharacterized protein DUF3846
MERRPEDRRAFIEIGGGGIILAPKCLIVIKPNAWCSMRPLDGPPELQELQEAVQGYLEAVPGFTAFCGQPCVAFCNEEGKLQELPFNPLATLHWAMAVGEENLIDDVLVGPVVIITGPHAFLERL